MRGNFLKILSIVVPLYLTKYPFFLTGLAEFIKFLLTKGGKNEEENH